MTIRYINATETGRIIRAELKQVFPGVKFSVKKSEYGGNIYVRWTDGPAETKVEDLMRKYPCIHFDGMYDNTTYSTTEWNGEEVQFGVQYIACQRTTTWAFVEAVLGCYEREYGKTALRIEGVTEHASIPFDYLHQSDHHYVKELLACTDAADMHDAYGALRRRQAERQAQWEAGAEERRRQQEEESRAEFDRRQQEAEQEAEAERLRQQEEAQKRAEQEAANKAYRERQAIRDGQRAILTNAFTARMFLGVPMNASEQHIKAAFRQKVSAVADGRGGYIMDMDFLVQVRDLALREE